MGKNKRINKLNLDLTDVSPFNDNQKLALDSRKNMILKGCAGTGKTYLALYKALKSYFSGNHKKVVVIRSAVPTRNIGFLPGTEKDKMAVYKSPYISTCNKLLSNGSAYESLERHGIISFYPTSFVRGTEFTNAFVVVDECQNMTFHELDSLITRLDEDSSIVFCGDTEQADLISNGFSDFTKILDRMDEFDSVEFGIDDIVRSNLVKSYLRRKYSHPTGY